MYFPPIPNPQSNGYAQQPIPPMYGTNAMYPMSQQQPPQQQPINPFMYPTKLQPYNDRQFLCKTFNFRVPLIEAFLSLNHEEKLKFFLICESRRLTGELTDKETYSKVLEKITMIVNPNYKKPQQQYKEISEEELKKKILEKEFQQKCEWELRKMGMGEEEMGGFGQSSSKSVKISNLSASKEANLQMMSNVRPSNSNNSINAGLSMNFDEFGMLGMSSIAQKTTTTSALNFNSDNKDDEDEFVYQQQEAPKDQGIDQWTSSTNNNDFHNNMVTNQTQQYQTSANQAFTQHPQMFTKQPDQQQWQQAQQAPQQSHPPSSYNNQQPASSPFQQPQSKVQSIWDLQINQQELNQSKPDIKEIFGIKKNQEEDFGGFEEGNAQMVGDSSGVGSFLRQNQFRYETVAEVSNDWLLGGGKVQSDRNVVGAYVDSHNMGNNNEVFDMMGVHQQMPQTNSNYIQPQWSFDNIHEKQYQHPVQQNLNPKIVLTQSSSINSQPTPILFDINQFDISSLTITPQTQSEPLLFINNSNNSEHPVESTSMTSMTLNFGFGDNSNTNVNNVRVDDAFAVVEMTSQMDHFYEDHKQSEEKKQQEDEWDEGEEVAVQAMETPDVEKKSTIQQSETPKQQISYDFNIPPNNSNQTSQQTTSSINLPTIPNQNAQFSLPSFMKPNNSSTNYDPFDTIEAAASSKAVENQLNDFSFTPQPMRVSQIVDTKVEELLPPVQKQREIKLIRKIIKPPSMRTIQIQSSNFNHFSSDKKEEKQQHAKPNLSSVIQPSVQQLHTNFQSPNQQIPTTTAFSKKPNLTSVNSLNLSIVPSLNIAVASSTNIPPSSLSLSQIPNQMSASTYIPQPQAPKQKIISTYSKQMTYTPDSFRSSIKSMLTKSKTFFKAFSKRSSGQEDMQQKEKAEHYSMVDMDYGKNREFLGGSQKVEPVYSPRVSSKGFGKNKGLDFSIDTHMIGEGGMGEFEGNDNEVNDLDTLNQNQSRFNTTKFTKRESLNRQEGNYFTAQDPIQDPRMSQNEIQQRQERQKILLNLSKSFILKLPQADMTYLNTQLKQNKFFFNKQFYLKLKSTLQKLSLSQDLTHFFNSLSRTSPSRPSTLQSTPFSTQLTFLSQIIQKLQKIDELNKKFTLAMEDDQEEELAEVVMKSKQLTFEVSEDGEVVKRIVGLVMEGRVKDNSSREDQDVDEQTDKYYGLYYMIVKLISQRPPSFNLSPLNQQPLHHLQTLYTCSPSPSLSTKSQFLYTSTLLYLLHTQLNQLQYIKNISQTVFGYMIKQHGVLIGKINEIKELSVRYAESPQGIFARLMEGKKMSEYLEGLGEMAMVAERLSEVARRVGVRFEKEEFGYDRLAKTITESKQLPTKYNLLKNTSTQANTESSYTPYLALILRMLTAGKSPQQISSQMRILLKQKPICKVCLAPRRQVGVKEGDFIENAVGVSQQSLGQRDSVEWCHYTCYNMLKMAFQDIAEENVVQ